MAPDTYLYPLGADRPGGLTLDFRKEEYFGGSGIGPFPFTWTQTCDGQSDPAVGPLEANFLIVNPEEVDTKPLPFGSTTLTGTAARFGRSWNWSFTASN